MEHAGLRTLLFDLDRRIQLLAAREPGHLIHHLVNGRVGLGHEEGAPEE
ncbi:MAG: hypothetical protein H6563_04575 [Lewinellaceae bacterium]|nr:hypothetical protein [Lewinellaceae bacterium]